LSDEDDDDEKRIPKEGKQKKLHFDTISELINSTLNSVNNPNCELEKENEEIFIKEYFPRVESPLTSPLTSRMIEKNELGDLDISDIMEYKNEFEDNQIENETLLELHNVLNELVGGIGWIRE
jgi:hypothetical protein